MTKTDFLKVTLVIFCLTVGFSWTDTPVEADSPTQLYPADGFNEYIVRAVEMLEKDYGGKGYNINKAYTHSIDYADGVIKPTEPPLTMCVAAVAEVIITAINLYVMETGDKTPYAYLPCNGWNRMRPTDIRSHIWVDHRLDSYGTADALVTFGIGKRVKFGELCKGSFININRDNKSGHAVVFLSYIDKNGRELPKYSEDQVAGFKYFSAQGGSSPGSGFGYRYAFFNKRCPELPKGQKRDCGVIYSTGQKLLNTGYMLHPKQWNMNQREENFKNILDGLYVQTRSRGDSYLGISGDISPDEFSKRLLDRDTMELNPLFKNANITTDDL